MTCLHTRSPAVAGCVVAVMLVMPLQAQPLPAPATPAATQPVPAGATPVVPDAKASDPIALGWMVGTPPPPEKTIRVADGSFYRFPQTRWSFSNWRRLFPTANVSRGDVAVVPLPRAERGDLDDVRFTRADTGQSMTFAESHAALYTDGVVVLHRGRVVYERYFGALDASRPHICFSVTKSFIGTLAAMLVAEGKLDEQAPVTRYVPELAGSGFGDATVRQVLDMTTSLEYSEIYSDPRSSFVAYARAAGFFGYPPGTTGPDGIHAFARSLAKRGPHGERFTYASPNTDVVAWLVARATGQGVETVLQERLWGVLGAEGDGDFALDRAGSAVASGGLNVRLRDLARFGEMMRLDGRYGGRQVVPAEVVKRIRAGGDRAAFAAAGIATLPGWSYRDQWWVAHDDHGAFMARGIHGQAIYVDPKAEMVVARFSSHPVASGYHVDPIVLPAYRALADHFLR